MRLLFVAAPVATAALFALYARVEPLWVAVGFFGLVPWLVSLDRISSLRAALASGWLLSVLFCATVFAWFAGAISHYTGAPVVVGWLVLLVLAPLLQPQFLAFAPARVWLRSRRVARPALALIGAAVYVGAEWAIPKLFADTIGHGLYASPLLRQAADLGGAPGLTFVLLIANECVLAASTAVATGWKENDAPPPAVFRPLAVFVLLLGGLLAYGSVRIQQIEPRGESRPLRAGIVQADISHYAELAERMGKYDAVRMILDRHFALSDALLRREEPDLLVWPETVYPTTFGAPKSADGAAFDREIAGFVSAQKVPLVFGSYDAESGQEYNAAIFLEPGAEGNVQFDSYRKASLFPLTERVPSWLDLPIVRRRWPWLGTWKPGVGARVVTVPLSGGRSVRVAPLICYDAVDPRLAIAAVRDGAELIVTLSNDSWFDEGGGPRLHLVVSAFRSLETRRPQVRATNTGISAIVTPGGDLLGSLGVHERGTLAATVHPVSDTWTLALAWGNWFGPFAFVVAAASLAVVGAAGRRR